MSFFGNIFNDENLNNIDDRIDSIIQALPSLIKPTESSSISSNFIDDFISEGPKNEVDKLLQDLTVSKERLDRYEIYDETLKYVPIIKRILSVYISNILQKNPVDGKCFLIKTVDNLKDSDEELKKVECCREFTKQCIQEFKLSLLIRKKILPNELVYGDCFVEVVDINSTGKKKVENISSISTSPLFEATISNFNRTVTQLQLKRQDNNKSYIFDDILKQISEYFVQYETSESLNVLNEQTDNGVNVNFENIIIKIHRPHEVIILESKTGNLLGYLVVSKDQSTQSINLTQTLSTLVGRITNLSGNDVKNENNISEKLVRFIIHSVIEKSKKSHANNKSINSIDDLLSDLPKEVFQQVKRLFIEQDIGHRNTTFNRLKVRFVSSLDMISFSTVSSQYDPYGQSFIDSLIFPCKLYILSQLSNVIIKLSRAAPVRKWTIDVGQTQMQSGMIQKLKRELYNTRTTVEDLNSFKSIPKILSDFKDMFLISKGGQKAIDLEVTSNGDPTIKVADLEDARREIMSLSGIPPAYLGFADVIELREQLVHTNVAFATEISDIQEGISESLTKMLDLIATGVGFPYKPSDFIQIQLIPPIILMLQVIETSLASIGNIAGTFQTMNISTDPFFLLEKYIPYIDWSAFKEKASAYEKIMTAKASLETSQNP